MFSHKIQSLLAHYMTFAGQNRSDWSLGLCEPSSILHTIRMEGEQTQTPVIWKGLIDCVCNSLFGELVFPRMFLAVSSKVCGFLSMMYCCSAQHKQDFSKRKRQIVSLSFSLESILCQKAKLRGDVHTKMYGFISP
jgi:hypothetical protein